MKMLILMLMLLLYLRYNDGRIAIVENSNGFSTIMTTT